MDASAELWTIVILTLLTSYSLVGMVISAAGHLKIGSDERTGVQKFHDHDVARLGGLPIFVALVAGLLALALITGAGKVQSAFLIVCLLPVFGIGLLEDLTRRVGESSRLIVAMISGVLGWWLFGAGLFRIGWEPADVFLSTHAWAGLAMTVLATAGSAHAVNIIDGCNGLSGFFIMAALTVVALVAGTVGDAFVLQVSLLALAATAGFFFYNFPHGRIFLGDSGAYMLGFLIAQLCLILITRHPHISPWCAMLILAYPAWEMLFSVYRRGRHGLRLIGRPDARHLHQLVYRRIMKWAPAHADTGVRHFRSAFTSMMMWPLILLCMAPAALFWNKSQTLFWLCWLFALSYTVIYLTIVRFKVPRFITRLVARQKAATEISPDFKQSEASR